MSRLQAFAVGAASAASLLAALMWDAPHARALDEGRGEKAAIKACDRKLCALLMHKNAKGEDLRCPLTKTWSRSKIKEAESARLSWGYGDARCTVDINVARASVVEALTGERAKFFAPPHTVNCVVEHGSSVERVTAVVAPKIEFKGGRADKIWINLKSVDGPAGIKATVYTATQLADRLGLFHGRMLRSINRYMEQHCPKEYSGVASGTDKTAVPK
jgi:hypothetical protein